VKRGRRDDIVAVRLGDVRMDVNRGKRTNVEEKGCARLKDKR
jgi:hypothetical protein